MEEVKEIKPGRLDPDAQIEWKPYEGEHVIDRLIIRQGKKIQEVAFKPDRVKAVASGNAYCIGNGPSRKEFDLTTLKDTGQTYGCNALYRDFVPDFLFSVDRFMSITIDKDKVWEKTVCYAPNIEVTRSKGHLHLIPNNPHWISGSAAFWTACVHGHKNVFLIGFDFREYGKGQLNNIYQSTENYGDRHSDTIFEPWLYQYRSICKMRPYVNFTVVHDNAPDYIHTIPFENHKLISYKEFNDTVLNQSA